MATINSVNNGLSGATGSGNFVGAISPTITTPIIAQIKDLNGNNILFLNGQSTPVNQSSIANSATGIPVSYGVNGSDTNIGINFEAKGTGQFAFVSNALTSPITIYNGTSGQHTTNFAFANTAAARTVTFQDLDGTIAFSSDIPSLPLALASGGTHANLSATGGTSQVLRQSTTGANITVSQLAASDLSNGTTGSNAVVLATSPTIVTPIISTISDTNGNANFTFVTATGAVNNLYASNSSTTNPVEFGATGSDSNISIVYRAKVTGNHVFVSANTTNPIQIYSGTASQHVTNFLFSNTSATRNITFPDTSGTVTLSSLTLPTTTAAQHIRTGATANVLVATNGCHWENIQVFTGSGTFNVPTDVTLVYVIALGSGGSGGGGTAGTVGSGGGSGSYAAGLVSVTPGGTVTVTIGGAATGGTTGNPGANGTDSSFGASVIGKAGSAGAAGAAVAGGLGGVAGTGTITTIGNPGGGGASIATTLASGYGGGSPMFGGGGQTTTGTGGVGGANTGGGGAGGRNANSGGNSGSGVVIVYY